MNKLLDMENTIQLLKTQIYNNTKELNNLNAQLQEFQKADSIIKIKPEIITMVQDCQDEGVLKRVYNLLNIPEGCPALGQPCYYFYSEHTAHDMVFHHYYDTKNDKERLHQDVTNPAITFRIVKGTINKYNRYRYNELLFATHEDALTFAKKLKMSIVD